MSNQENVISEFMRLVLVVPMNGRLDDCYRVWERDGSYIVTDSGNTPLKITGKPEEAMSLALSLAAWGVRVRKATAKDYA